MYLGDARRVNPVRLPAGSEILGLECKGRILLKLCDLLNQERKIHSLPKKSYLNSKF